VLNAYQGALPNGGELSFSIRDFRTPDGRRLEGNSVEPDMMVEYHLDDLRAGRDPGIEDALNELRHQKFGTIR
jgi:C-terminal processing protease CtpA/Prc